MGFALWGLSTPHFILATFRTKTTLKEICLRFPGHGGDGFVGLPADIYERLNGLKKHGLHITVARYKRQLGETGRELEQVLFD
jgi:hypothetical protein